MQKLERLLAYAAVLLLAGLVGCSSTVESLSCDAGLYLKDGVCIPVTVSDAGASDATSNGDGAIAMDAEIPDSGIAAATLSTTQLDFGGVVTSSSASLKVTVRNPSTLGVTVTFRALGGANPGDFSASSTTTIHLAAGAEAELALRFAPASTGARAASYAVQLCDGGCDTILTLSGVGLLQALDCQPTPLDFHFVTPMSCRQETVTCSNVSSQYLTLVSFALARNSAPSFTLSTPSSTRNLAPGAAEPIALRYCPTSLGVENGLLAITTLHPDPQRSIQSISLTGQGGGPNLQCLPPAVDFGVSGLGQHADRVVLCQNTGTVPLLISSASFGAGSSAGLSLSLQAMGATVTVPRSLTAAGDILELHLRYAPLSAGTASTSVMISSNDSDTPLFSIPIRAGAIDATGCALSASPALLDFGSVTPGSTSGLVLTVRNTGSGACAVSGIHATGGPFLALPRTPVLNIAPSASVAIPVNFSPPIEGSFMGALSMQTTDPQQPLINVPIEGVAFRDALSFSPPSVDFGEVPLGCARAITRVIDISAPGTPLAQPLVVTASLAAGSSPAFGIATATRTFSIAPLGHVSLAVSFSPTSATMELGRLEFRVLGGPTQYVSLAGTGSPSATNTITLSSGPSAPVDLLFVVTDTPSMAVERALLASAAAAFIARADALGVDYHIGVTSSAGDLNGGTLLMPVITAQSPSRAADLAHLFGALAGSLPGPQTGLFNAEWAVNANLPANQGFLRPNATYSVVVVSDQDDSSAGAVADLISQMTHRPIGIQSNTRVSLLGGGLTGCNGPNGTVPPALVYLQAVQATAGALASICDASFTSAMTTLADASFAGAGPGTIQLGSPPAPGSVEVRVNGTLLPARTGTVSHYYVDYRRAQLSFAPGSAPAALATVEIRYAPLCVAASCGNGHLDPGEQCDDGNRIDTDACPSTCFTAFCGDGFSHAPSEQCDDGNTQNGDGCNSTCTIEGCGNGVLEPGEECDDGQANSNSLPNACRTDCRRAHCHDGVVDSGEQCDDGNLSNTDACVDQCVNARCGDGHVHLGAEACDDGNSNNLDFCSNACTWNVPAFTVTRTDNRPLTPTPGGIPLGFRGTAGNANLDDGVSTATIGFPFSFLGASVTNALVSTNGLIAFEATNAQAYLNPAIPDAAAPNAFIAWWWDDLNFGRMGLPAVNTVATTSLLGTMPNRTRVLTLLNVPAYAGGDVLLNVEIRLHEGTNLIEVHYGALGQVSPTPSNFSASVGWESTAGARGVDVLGCSPNCATANWPANAIFSYTP